MTEEHHSDHSDHGEHHSAPHHSANNGVPEIPKVDFKNVNADSLKGGLGDVLNILKLDKAAMEKVAHRDSEGLGLAIVYFAVGTMVASLGPAIFGVPVPFVGVVHTSFVNALVGGVIVTVLGLVGFFIMNWVATGLFKGSGKFPQFFRVMGYASLVRVVNVFTIVPFLSLVTGVLLLVILYRALTGIHKLNATNAVLTILLSAVIGMVVGGILMSAGLGTMMGLTGTGSYRL